MCKNTCLLNDIESKKQRKSSKKGKLLNPHHENWLPCIWIMTQALVFVFIFTLQFGLRNDFVIPENHKHTCMKTFEILLNILNFIYPWWIGVSISRTFERGRGSLCLHGFQTFFLKNRFLSDYVVSACPKYIFGKLRSFLKISEKKFLRNFSSGRL